MRGNMERKRKKPGLDLILGVVLLVLTGFLASAAVRQIRSGSHWMSAAVSICGVVLFGAIGVSLLVGEIRRRMKKRN